MTLIDCIPASVFASVTPRQSIIGCFDAEKKAQSIMRVRAHLGHWDVEREAYVACAKASGWLVTTDTPTAKSSFEYVYERVDVPLKAALFAPAWTRAAFTWLGEQLEKAQEPQADDPKPEFTIAQQSMNFLRAASSTLLGSDDKEWECRVLRVTTPEHEFDLAVPTGGWFHQTAHDSIVTGNPLTLESQE